METSKRKELNRILKGKNGKLELRCMLESNDRKVSEEANFHLAPLFFIKRSLWKRTVPKKKIKGEITVKKQKNDQESRFNNRARFELWVSD